MKPPMPRIEPKNIAPLRQLEAPAIALSELDELETSIAMIKEAGLL